MKPSLRDEWEDFYSLVYENGQIKGNIFSHLEEFKQRFREKARKI